MKPSIQKTSASARLPLDTLLPEIPSRLTKAALQRRREQNRRAQQNYKQRKDQQLQELSSQLAELRDKYGRCAEQCVSLSTELAVIRSTLARMVSGDGSAAATAATSL